MQHPGNIELAYRQRYHHKRPRQNAVAAVRHHHGEKAAPETGAEAGGRLFEARQLNRLHHRQHRTDHKGQRKEHMADQDKQPAVAQAVKPAVKQNNAERGGEARQRHRQHQALFDASGPARRRLQQAPGGGQPDRDGNRQAADRNQQRQPEGVGVERPHLTHPLQRQAAAQADKVILRDARQHRQHHRHDHKQCRQRGNADLQPEQHATFHDGRSPPACVSARASIRPSQATAPIATDSAAAVAKLA